jgi:hypothetical protein
MTSMFFAGCTRRDGARRCTACTTRQRRVCDGIAMADAVRSEGGVLVPVTQIMADGANARRNGPADEY